MCKTAKLIVIECVRSKGGTSDSHWTEDASSISRKKNLLTVESQVEISCEELKNI